MFRKLVALIPLLACLWTNPAAAMSVFADVPESSPFRPHIERLHALGIIDGFDSNRFGPEEPISRAEAVKMMVLAFQLYDGLAEGIPVPFHDIEGHWSEPYVRAAFQAGLVDGTSQSAFSPDQPITREEAAAIIWRHAKTGGLSPSPILPLYEQPAPWAAEAISSVIDRHWYSADVQTISGRWSYRPQSLMKRQEMAALLDSAMKEIPGALQMEQVAAERGTMRKATYVWDPGILKHDKAGLLRFIRDQEVNLVLLHISPGVPRETYASFIEEAGSIDVEVKALGGNPRWIYPERVKEMYELIEWVAEFNRSVMAEQRFTGIHLDVEPYVLPEWKYDSDRMLGLWRDLISGFVQQTRESAPGLVTGLSIPDWLDEIRVPDGNGGRMTMSGWLIREADETILMAYHDHAENIIRFASGELKEAEQFGKPITVALETRPNLDSLITFHNKGKSRLEAELAKVIAAFQKSPSFRGIAIHDYVGWSGLND
jgi:hypothetical protein